MTLRLPEEHGSDRTYRNGCRCEICSAQRAIRSREARIKRIEETPFEKIPHGRKGYGLYMCRCDTCREAGSTEASQRRGQMSLREQVPHGTLNGYTNYGCRCESCAASRKEFKRTYDLRERYGLTPGDYDEIMKSQGGKCAICLSYLNGRGSVDHCHNSKKVRGLLCSECNFGLGHSRDSPEVIRSAIAYISERNPL